MGACVQQIFESIDPRRGFRNDEARDRRAVPARKPLVQHVVHLVHSELQLNMIQLAILVRVDLVEALLANELQRVATTTVIPPRARKAMRNTHRA